MRCLAAADNFWDFCQEFFQFSDVEDVGLIEKASLANQVDGLIGELFGVGDLFQDSLPVEMVRYVGMS